MIKKTSYIDAGKIGTLDNRIPVISIGEGKPVISIMCGVHGNESSGFFIIHKLIERLKSFSSINGTVNFISAVNPIALINSTRISTLDFLDLNRVGIGDPEGSYTQRIAYKLFDYFKKSDLMIDIHEFEMISPFLATHIDFFKNEATEKKQEAIAALAPTAIWTVNNDSGSDKIYNSTMKSSLLKNGIPNFIVETSSIQLLTVEDMENIISGFLRVLSLYKMINGSHETHAKTRAFFRQVVTSHSPGLFLPEKNILSEIEKGDIVGKLIHYYDDYHVEEIRSPYSGTLFQIMNKKLINAGAFLFSVGSEDEKLSKKIQELQHTRNPG